jgi:peptidoglycan/LPS O-acetylase OafA/YrhL
LLGPGSPALSGGYLGVDLFFVLSGFLITSLLVAERRRTGGIALRKFWARRARRLLPALALALLLVAAYSRFAAAPSELSRIRGDSFATMFYVENWHLVILNPTIGSPLNHMWSLSVEEQWYLLWPLALLGLFTLARTRDQLRNLIFGCAAVAALWTFSLFRSGVAGARMYNGTDTRAVALLVGAALALLIPSLHANVRLGPVVEGVGVLGAIAIGWFAAKVSAGDSYLYQGGLLLFALASAAVITAAVRPGGVILRPLLSSPPLRVLGVISYGVYLFSWPFYFWIAPPRVNVTGLPLFALRVAATLTLAVFSFFLVERPIRNGKVHRRSLSVLAPVTALLTVAALLGATAGAESIPPYYTEPTAHVPSAVFDSYRSLGERVGQNVTKLLVVGDGNALALSRAALNPYRTESVTGTVFANSGCGLAEGTILVDGVALPQCSHWPDEYRDVIDAYRPTDVALMVGFRELFPRRVEGRRLSFATRDMQMQLDQELDRARVVTSSGGARFILLTVPCAAEKSVGGLPATTFDRRAAWINHVFRDYAEKHAGEVTLADLSALLCTSHSGPVLRSAQGFTRSGATATWNWLAAAVLQR